MRDYNQIQFRSPRTRSTNIPQKSSVEKNPLSTPIPLKTNRVSRIPKSTKDSPPHHKNTPDSTQRPNGGPRQLSASSTSTATTSETEKSADLNHSDALALRREGPQAVVGRLRLALDQAVARESAAKSAQAQADATILELRSSLRQLKRSNENASQAQSVELQNEVDKAHAQLLTADMVRRELEDTLEAEQYTWELRVQDQERTIAQLQQDRDELVQQLEEKPQGKGNDSDLKKQLSTLESERAELQTCLDEALKELEAVDQELQHGDEGLRQENEKYRRQHEQLASSLRDLYTEIAERDPSVDDVVPRDSADIVAALRQHVQAKVRSVDSEALQAARAQVKELQSQVSVYRGDLQAREESSAELRASLKDAVEVLKPLQDRVDKADREKQELMRKIRMLESGGGGQELRKQLQDRERQIDQLEQQLESLELELSRAKLMVANNVLISQQKRADESSSGSASRSLGELKAKRSAESALQKMLKDTQSRFQALQDRSVEIEARNGQLQQQLEGNDQQQEQVLELQKEAEALRKELARKESEVNNLAQKLQAAQALGSSDDTTRELQAKLRETTDQVRAKKENERKLNGTLKEALGLLKPLQMHLEEAEKEKRELLKQIQSGTSSGRNEQTLRELQSAVKHLERENSQLHDALEDASQLNASHLSGMSNKTDSKIRAQFVEMKSRYEVTRNRLEGAEMENNALLEDLNKRDEDEQAMIDELTMLRQELKSSEAELENAKYIATSALVRVDELSMNNVEQPPINADSLYKEKARLVEQKVSSTRSGTGKKQVAQYRRA